MKVLKNTALIRGKLSENAMMSLNTIQCRLKKINIEFYLKNKEWFVEGNPQIGKYGLWRPIIVNNAFSKLNENDYLVYVASGCYFVNSVKYIINYMEEYCNFFLRGGNSKLDFERNIYS